MLMLPQNDQGKKTGKRKKKHRGKKKDHQLNCYCSSKVILGNGVTAPQKQAFSESVAMGIPKLDTYRAGEPDMSAVLTWLFGWLNQLRVQVWAVLRVYSALVLLPTTTYSVQTHPCRQRQFTVEILIFETNQIHREYSLWVLGRQREGRMSQGYQRNIKKVVAKPRLAVVGNQIGPGTTNPKDILCKAVKVTFTHQRKGMFSCELIQRNCFSKTMAICILFIDDPQKLNVQAPVDQQTSYPTLCSLPEESTRTSGIELD